MLCSCIYLILYNFILFILSYLILSYVILLEEMGQHLLLSHLISLDLKI